MLFRITMPMIWAVFIPGVPLWFITSIKIFDIIIVSLDFATPAVASFTLSVSVWANASGTFYPVNKLEYATAIGVLILILVIICSTVLRFFRRRIPVVSRLLLEANQEVLHAPFSFPTSPIKVGLRNYKRAWAVTDMSTYFIAGLGIPYQIILIPYFVLVSSSRLTNSPSRGSLLRTWCCSYRSPFSSSSAYAVPCHPNSRTPPRSTGVRSSACSGASCFHRPNRDWTALFAALIIATLPILIA